MECGAEHDRDLNAAMNLQGLIAGSATAMPVQEVVSLSYGLLMASGKKSTDSAQEPSSDVRGDVN